MMDLEGKVMARAAMEQRDMELEDLVKVAMELAEIYGEVLAMLEGPCVGA